MNNQTISGIIEKKLWGKLDKSKVKLVVAKENTCEAKEKALSSLDEFRENLRKRAVDNGKLLSKSKRKVKKIKKALKNEAGLVDDLKDNTNHDLLLKERAEDYAAACLKLLDVFIETTEIAICEAIVASVIAERITESTALDTDSYDD